MVRRIYRHLPKQKLILAFGDSLLIFGGLLVTSAIISPRKSALPLPEAAVLILITFFLSFYLANLYSYFLLPYQKKKIVVYLVFAIGGAAGFLEFFSFIMPDVAIGWQSLTVFALVMLLTGYLWRNFFESVRRWLGQPIQTLIIGTGWAGATIGSCLEQVREFKVIGYVSDDLSNSAVKTIEHLVLGATPDLLLLVDRHQPALIVLAITSEQRDDLSQVLLECKMRRGIEFSDMSSLYEELTGKIPVSYIRDSWFLDNLLRGIQKTLYTVHLKRLADVVLSLGGFVLSLPLSVFSIVAIIVEDGFPVLYKQKRVGQNEREFWLLKYRSMRKDSEDSTGAVWAKFKDDRVTKVGQVLRLFHIDEIPQMWNVLKGEMSFIGPRPEQPKFVSELKEKISYYWVRHLIKPGITGWAQVNYPYGASEEDAQEKLQYDLYYIKSMSVLLDFHILLRTIRVVLFRQGSR